MLPNSESVIQQRVCLYLATHYPDVIFRSDFASGLKLSIAQASLHKRLQSSRAWPDLHIVEPRGEHAGLFIELKRKGVVVFKQDGTLRADEHLQEQAAMLASLRERGYRAEFAIGYDAAVALIESYLF
ncbi:hypothetical protein GTU73_09440 [Rathayibacter sp. VKM Ac-2804]|uniref:hypothetical protein n=1 Tax=Rathayibacter sp. VKM Ac-2804 TaxID=2609257 RepID=UPI00132E7AB8|nr:hypothetical protein [Rathayibacter sp. VKM Ac-2804]QHF24212.1 hypothetical protein GTU73_09440 [Rathayibacter sp. VKM Ac-2804]